MEDVRCLLRGLRLWSGRHHHSGGAGYMGCMKNMWLVVHDQLMEEYAAAHPDATDEQCSEATWLLVDEAIANMKEGES